MTRIIEGDGRPAQVYTAVRDVIPLDPYEREWVVGSNPLSVPWVVSQDADAQDVQPNQPIVAAPAAHTPDAQVVRPPQAVPVAEARPAPARQPAAMTGHDAQPATTARTEIHGPRAANGVRGPQEPAEVDPYRDLRALAIPSEVGAAVTAGLRRNYYGDSGPNVSNSIIQPIAVLEGLGATGFSIPGGIRAGVTAGALTGLWEGVKWGTRGLLDRPRSSAEHAASILSKGSGFGERVRSVFNFFPRKLIEGGLRKIADTDHLLKLAADPETLSALPRRFKEEVYAKARHALQFVREFKAFQRPNTILNAETSRILDRLDAVGHLAGVVYSDLVRGMDRFYKMRLEEIAEAKTAWMDRKVQLENIIRQSLGSMVVPAAIVAGPVLIAEAGKWIGAKVDALVDWRNRDLTKFQIGLNKASREIKWGIPNGYFWDGPVWAPFKTAGTWIYNNWIIPVVGMFT